MFIFWMVIILSLPLLLLFKAYKAPPEQDELKQSEFETCLMEHRVRSAAVLRDAGSQLPVLAGTYVPKNARPAPEAAPAAVSETKAPAREAKVKEEVRGYHVAVVYTEALDKLLRENCEVREARNTSHWYESPVMWMLYLVLPVVLLYFLFSRQMRMAGRGAMQFGKSRARLIMPNQEKVTFADVSGIDEAKEEVSEVIDFLRDPQKFQKLGGRIPKGVLMVGPPGTGKTLLARAIAGEAEVPFFSISGSDFVEMFVGVGASRVRDMFEEGKRHAPCIIFIDEIDAVGRSRFSGIGGGHDEREQTLNALLVEMDGFETNTGVIVIAATNRPDVLDPALLRPGRFDRQIAIDLPDVAGRLGILKVHAKKIKLAEKVELEIIARGTPGFSGADLANLVNESALIAAHQNKVSVEMADLEEARDKVRWGKERRSRKIDEHDRAVTAYHEAGHALVALLCVRSMPLHKVTIIPRGNAYLGATMHLPENDRYTKSRAEFIEELSVLMGGRIAETLIFQDITSGASMDIRQATEIAKKMVCQWGMSDKIGPLSYGGREEHIFLGRDITRSEDFSEETSREIDNEIKRLVIEAETHTRNLLETNLERLKTLGKALLEHETMSAAEIRTLLGFPPAPPTSSENTKPAVVLGDPATIDAVAPATTVTPD